MRKLLSSVFVAVVSFGCSEPNDGKILLYDGPVVQMEQVETFYTENDQIVAILRAPVAQQSANEDFEYPKGLYLELFDEFGALKSTMKANHAYYFKSQDTWRARGNVILKKIIENQQLNTEELFWYKPKQKVYTEKFVTIRDSESVIYGEGLEAKDDFSDYHIVKVTGEIMLNNQ